MTALNRKRPLIIKSAKGLPPPRPKSTVLLEKLLDGNNGKAKKKRRKGISISRPSDKASTTQATLLSKTPLNRFSSLLLAKSSSSSMPAEKIGKPMSLQGLASAPHYKKVKAPPTRPLKRLSTGTKKCNKDVNGGIQKEKDHTAGDKCTHETVGAPLPKKQSDVGSLQPSITATAAEKDLSLIHI